MRSPNVELLDALVQLAGQIDTPQPRHLVEISKCGLGLGRVLQQLEVRTRNRLILAPKNTAGEGGGVLERGWNLLKTCLLNEREFSTFPLKVYRTETETKVLQEVK